MGMIDWYNLVWDSPSKDHNGSMPIGNGETGLNIWVESSGDILLYISRTDSWDENERLCKIGGCRIKFLPEINLEIGQFSQTLNLEKGRIEIIFKIMGYSYDIYVWVDAHNQCINFEFSSIEPTTAKIILENWRENKRKLDKDEYFFLNDEKGEYYSWPDEIVETNDEKSVCWYHHNTISRWQDTLKLQYLEELIDTLPDPLLHRTFGAKIYGKGFINKNSSTLELKTKKKSYNLQISTLTISNCENVDAWLNEIDQLAQNHKDLDIDNTRKEHEFWWNEFWNRSWIYISGFDEAEKLTQNYALQRWMQACGGRGNYAIKFNGSIFTVKTDKYDPDYRRWGGWYWFQNTRFPYWPMIASGDWEMMDPFWKLYLGTRELAVFRNKKYYNHDGWFFPETMSSWGTYVNQNFGLDQTGKKAGVPIENKYIRWHFNATLELLTMMLDYYLYTDDIKFLKEKLLPTADDYMMWWKHHWTLDPNGKLVMEPSQSLETYWGIKNPTPDIAGLQWCLDELLHLSDDEIGVERRKKWTNFRKQVPEIPLYKIRYGLKKYKTIAPCEPKIVKRTNCENTRLYPIFPFRIFGLGKPNLDVAIDTFNTRFQKNFHGWGYDEICASLLGLTEDAEDMILDRAFNKHKESRFPAFWGPNYDWIPDQTHGGNLLMAVQFMLLQPDREKMRLLPAWPKNWNVHFKLHGPHNTTVECRYKNSQIERLIVNPEENKKNIRH